MTVLNKAVFLSYASQDAEAARRICDALRAAGVEVWFDQSELRGGDSWDAKIRKQIKECALFVPIISGNTQARREGYFRLEWKLAEDRTHLMARGTPFLVPVCIDDTNDWDALVPDSFTAVQWIRLPRGEAPAAFTERITRLLTAESGPAARRVKSRTDGSEPSTSLPARRADAASEKRRRRWMIPTATAITLTIGVALVPIWRRVSPPANIPGVPASKSEQLIATARGLYEPWDLASADDFKMADGLLKQAADVDAVNADAWAAYAICSYGHLVFGFDASDARLDLLRTSAERAAKLAPNSVRAKLARAVFYQRRPGMKEDALKLLGEVIAGEPGNKFALRESAAALRSLGRTEDGLALLDRAAALPGGDPIARFMRGVFLRTLGRFDEADAAFNQALSERPDFGRARVMQLQMLFYDLGDLRRVKQLIEQLSARSLNDERVAMLVAYYWYLLRDPSKAGDALRHVTQEYIEATPFHSPKAYLTGYIHLLAGRNGAAADEFRVALRLVDRRLAGNPTDSFDQYLQVELQALLGNRDAAQKAMLAVEEKEADRTSNNLLVWQVYALLGQEEKLADFFTRQFKPGTSANAGLSRGFRALFRTHPLLDPYRDRPRFKELAADVERFYVARTTTAAGFDHGAQSSLRGSRDATDLAPLSGRVEKSIAVLAFDNLSDDKANEYFADGISEELINRLGQVPGLTVRGRTSAFYFKGNPKVSSAEIAQRLDVAYLLRGSVRKSGNKVRITAQLTRAATDEVVWSSDPLTKEIADVFTAQEEIARFVAQSLQLKLAIQTATSAHNAEALRLYLEGRQLWNLRTSQALDRAEALFNQALALDPKFVRARVGRADVWKQRYSEFSKAGESLARFANRNSPLVSKITAEAEAALAEDPTLAEAHTTIGNALWLTWQDAEAEEHFRRALSLNPNYATGHQWLGRLLLREGRLDEALAELAKAAELDPLSPIILDNYGMVLLCAGDPAAALPVIERALLFRPDSLQTLSWRAWALTDLGRVDDAVVVARRLAENPNAAFATPRTFLRAGMTAEAEAFLQRPDIATDELRWFARLGIGRPAEALAYLQPDAMNSQEVHYLLFLREFDPVRNEPRFQQLLKDLGLEQAHARAQAWRAAHPRVKMEGKK